MARVPLLASAVLASLVLFATRRPAAALVCEFDTNGDGVPELVVPDVDGDGFCDFPDHKTDLPGTLVFAAGEPVELHGTPVIEADSIVIEPGAVIVGDPATLRSLTMTAKKTDLIAFGTVAISASDDVTLSTKLGSIDLFGPTLLHAADHLLLNAQGGWISIAPTDVDPSGPLTLLGGNRVDLRAKSADGSIVVDGATVGGAVVALDAVANLSVVRPKAIVLTDGALLTTDPARSGAPSGGDITLAATGDVDVGPAVVLDSGRNLSVSTQRTGENVCLEGAPTLEAQGPTGNPGQIDLRNVDGQTSDDGSEIVTGNLLEGDNPGPCGSGTCIRQVAVQVAEADTAAPAAFADAPVAFADAEEFPKQAFVDAHNAVRKAITDAKAKNLKDLQWSDVAQASAQAWADKLAADCKCEHSFNAGLVQQKIDGDLTLTATSSTGRVGRLNDSAAGKSALKKAIGAESPPEQHKPVLQDAKGQLVDEKGNVTTLKGIKQLRNGQLVPDGFVPVGENVATVVNVESTEDPDTGEFKFEGDPKKLSLADVAARAVKSWADEQDKFDYTVTSGSRCKKGAKIGKGKNKDKAAMCGHYSQIIWEQTMFVGCGIASCMKESDALLSTVVCQYLPKGNIDGQPPYVKKK
jgi:hypothetical protein